MREQAIWFGRFQPPSIAHLAALEMILESWEVVNIGVVKYTSQPKDIDPELSARLKDEASFSSERNPFTPEEVCEMWSACALGLGLAPRVKPHIVPRPEYWPDYGKVFPPQEFDHVQVGGGSGDSATEAFRLQFYPKYYGRTIWRITPPFMLHNSEIRQRVMSGKGTWSDYIPAGAYEVFVRIGGPSRIGVQSP